MMKLTFFFIIKRKRINRLQFIYNAENFLLISTKKYRKTTLWNISDRLYKFTSLIKTSQVKKSDVRRLRNLTVWLFDLELILIIYVKWREFGFFLPQRTHRKVPILYYSDLKYRDRNPTIRCPIFNGSPTKNMLFCGLCLFNIQDN